MERTLASEGAWMEDRGRGNKVVVVVGGEERGRDGHG